MTSALGKRSRKQSNSSRQTKRHASDHHAQNDQGSDDLVVPESTFNTKTDKVVHGEPAVTEITIWRPGQRVPATICNASLDGDRGIRHGFGGEAAWPVLDSNILSRRLYLCMPHRVNGIQASV